MTENPCTACYTTPGSCIHEHADGTWWFWDETGNCEGCGPYPDRETASRKLDEYCRNCL